MNSNALLCVWWSKCGLYSFITRNNLVVNCRLLSHRSSLGYDNCKCVPCGDNVTDSVVTLQFFYVLQHICCTMSRRLVMKIDPLVTHNLHQHSSSCLNPSSVLAFTITTSQIIAFYFNLKKNHGIPNRNLKYSGKLVKYRKPKVIL